MWPLKNWPYLGNPGCSYSDTQCWCASFWYCPHCNHAILYLDLSYKILTGISWQALYDPTHPEFRNLWSTDIKAAEQYLTLVQQGFHAENIHNQIAILESCCRCTGKCTLEDEQILNKLTVLSHKFCYVWRSNARKQRATHGHPFLPMLCLMDHAHEKIHTKKQLKEAYAILQNVQTHAKQIHDSFLEDWAEHLANTWEIAKVAAVPQILHAECQAITFWKLGTWLKRNEYDQFTWVLIPDNSTDLTNTTWKLIVEAQDLYDILMKEGQLHYHQAAETPLVNGPLAKKIGPFDDNEYWDKILNGNFDTSNLATISEVRDIVSGMRYPNPNNPTPSSTLPRLLMTTFSKWYFTHGNVHHYHHPDDTTAIFKHSCATLLYLDAFHQFVSSGVFCFTDGRKLSNHSYPKIQGSHKSTGCVELC